MQTSKDRIQTTHVGSLIRPAEVRVFSDARSRGEKVDEAAETAALKTAVAEVARVDRALVDHACEVRLHAFPV